MHVYMPGLQQWPPIILYLSVQKPTGMFVIRSEFGPIY